MEPKGSIFRKADLHIHTPASNCYSKEEKGNTAVQIIEDAASKGLEVIGVTDHNDIAFLEDIRTEGAKKGIIVFPGIEISTPEAHLLALFEPEYPIAKLDEFLPYIHIKGEERGEKEAMADSFEDVLRKIEECGGIAIAAHANSTSGILHSAYKGAYKKRVCNNPALSALELSNPQHIGRFSQGLIYGYPAKPCICGSDAHCLAEIGQRYTYLKMDVVTINGLKQALIDWPIKVKYPWETIQSCCPRIQSVTVTQGFFKDTVFQFNPNLTCFVGGTGTGKSTVIEFLRYCLNDLSSFKEIQNDTYGKVEKLIGPGGLITVEYVCDDGHVVQISREVSDHINREEVTQRIVDDEGQPALMSSKPTFFSQGEISRIAMNSVAQLELIDKYIDISEENRKEQEANSSLNTNAHQLSETTEQLRELTEILTDPETGKIAITQERDRLRRQLTNPIFSEFPKWESEGRYIKHTLESIGKLEKDVLGLIGGVNMQEYFPVTIDASSPNYAKLTPFNGIVENVCSIISAIGTEFSKSIASIFSELDKLHKEWEPLFEKKKEEYNDFLNGLGAEDITKAQARLRAYNERLDELEKVEAKASVLSTKENAIREARNKLIGQLKEARNDRFNKRFAKAKEWETKLDGKVGIDIVASGDRDKYINTLTVATTGSFAHKPGVARIAFLIQPYDLIRAVQNKDTTFIKEQSGADSDDVDKIVDYLNHKDLAELLKLEISSVSDLPKISFEVEGVFKPIDELATGTKSIVIVSLAMIEGDAPLIIDQPEDSLNTEFIYSQIVSKLRHEKESRQFIFTSHNANVVVASDTDLTYVLTATSDQGSVDSSGGIDNPKTNELLLLHLEGGPAAFKLRTQKYEQSIG